MDKGTAPLSQMHFRCISAVQLHVVLQGNTESCEIYLIRLVKEGGRDQHKIKRYSRQIHEVALCVGYFNCITSQFASQGNLCVLDCSHVLFDLIWPLRGLLGRLFIHRKSKSSRNSQCTLFGRNGRNVEDEIVITTTRFVL